MQACTHNIDFIMTVSGGIMNYKLLTFSQELAQQRIDKAVTLFGSRIVYKILGYALFLLGMHKPAIALFLNVKEGSLRTLIHALHTQGLNAFEDGRTKATTFKTPLSPTVSPSLQVNDSCIKVDLGVSNMKIHIPIANRNQIKVILLTLYNNGILTCLDTAKALELSEDRTKKLARILSNQDAHNIIDQRNGQKQDYLFSPEIKAEIIQQFVLNVINHDRVSGNRIAQALYERCKLKLSPRSILYHFSKLGLNHIRESLPARLAEIKKNSSVW